MKKSVKVKRYNYLFKRLSELSKKGISYDRILNGKPIESYIKSEKMYKRTLKRINELPYIIKTGEKQKEKFFKSEQKRIRKEVKKQIDEAHLHNKVLDTVKNFKEKFPQFQPFIQAKNLEELRKMEDKLKKSKRLKDLVPEVINTESSKFFDSYFMELELDEKEQVRLNKIKKAFGEDYDIYNDFIEYVTHSSFTGEYDSDQEKKRDPEGYHREMQNRLSKMESVLRTKFYKGKDLDLGYDED